MNQDVEELKHWVWSTHKAIADCCQKLNEVMNVSPALGSLDVEKQRLNSEAEAKIHSVVNTAHHMFKAAIIAKVDESVIDESLNTLVRNLRNLREHWDENKKYFENSELVIPKTKNTISARWFRKHFPDSTPWSAGWTNLCGYTIGPLYLGQLFEQGTRLLFVTSKINNGNL